MANADVGKYRKGLLRLGGTCNNACFFCHARGATSTVADLDTQECRRRIEVLARAGIEMVVFSGGEPTIRKDLIELCRFAGEKGLKSGIITNGRMLCYADFTRSLFEAGARYFLLSLHGDDETIHNRHTGTDSYRQTLAGLAAVSQYPVQLVVNTVLTTINAPRLDRIAGLLSRFGPLRYKVSLPEPRGVLLENMRYALNPEAAAVAANKLSNCVDPSIVDVGFDGFTPCLLNNYFSLNDDFFTHGFCFVWNTDEDSCFPPDRGDRSYLNTCVFCAYYGLCPGIYSRYLSVFPKVCLQPVLRAVSNSICFEQRSSHPDPGGAACVEPFMSVPQPARWLALRDSGRLLMYSTNESMTDVPELCSIKNDLEQVYSVDPRKTQSFFKQERLSKLRLTDTCRGCEKIYACPGVFEKATGVNPFDEALSDIMSLLDRVKGSVCESGCGEGPLFEYFKERHRAGAISLYLGVDPALPESGSFGDGSFILKNVRFEDLTWDGKKFDNVIMFRSYNHLNDLEQGMKTLDAITTAGSMVIIAEDARHIEIPTGRSNRKKKAADFHHYRNHSLRDVERLLDTWGFKTIETFPVTNESASHWILTARKISS